MAKRLTSRKKYYLQPPVANTVSAGDTRFDASQLPGFDGLLGWRPAWFGSGTMALAAILKSIRIESDRESPKIALAAYGCPDLVAAIRFAGAEPVYVDFESDELRICLDELHTVCGSDDEIIAVVGVDLFGVPENWAGLQRVADKFGLSLVQDCAQSLQPRSSSLPDYRGDFIVHSFGRGKPACLLGGGVALVQESKFTEFMSVTRSFTAPSRDTSFNNQKVRWSLRVFDFILKPRVYWWVVQIFGSRIGQTEYRPLEAISAASEGFGGLANSITEEYWRDDRNHGSANVRHLKSGLIKPGADRVFALVADCTDEQVLLRLPLLARDKHHRELIISRMINAGISATAMYEKTLPELVNNASQTQSRSTFPNATRVSRDLYTLPIHYQIGKADIRRMLEVLAEVHQN